MFEIIALIYSNVRAACANASTNNSRVFGHVLENE